MNKSFYITTTLPYVNAPPHIGFALEIVQADTLARYQRLLGKKVFFNTGTDEHGLKIYRQAQAEKKDPQQYVDEYAEKFDRLKQALNLSYNNFIRTTDQDHLHAAKEFWRRCQANGDIYRAKQKIKYCVGCELEKTDSELSNGRCPLHPDRKLETIEEENYFFRFSKYQEPLIKLYRQKPHLVVPSSRFKEIKTFVSQGLKDFSISRVKKKMPWGIEVPGDSRQVIYVWFDALINYVSAVGWPTNLKKFNQWWPGIQIAGKDNLRQQTAIWQAMLMSAGLPNSQQILIHGFITAEGQKMSKSLGNVVNPFDLVEQYDTDPLRYYLLKTIHPTKDSDFTNNHFQEVYNADLANGLGNLVQRTSTLCQRLKTNTSLHQQPVGRYDQLAAITNKKLASKYNQFLQNYQFNKALQLLWKEIASLDQFIDKNEPWTKKGKKLESILKTPVEQLLQLAVLLKPFLPSTAQKIKEIFLTKKINPPQEPLFPRK